MNDNPHQSSGLLLYQTEDGRTRLEVRLDGETIWLAQAQMAELFQTSKQNISLHIQNVFEEGELSEEAAVKEYLTTAADGKSYRTKHYNLDMVVSVGYRVRSHRGTQFRIWATQRLREYIVKGFTMDDERLKNPPGHGQKDYFDEQLERIRDIRSSERRFYQKVLDIYATSVDYTPAVEMSQKFFATVQNKMHWATHGHTAAEIIHERADASKPFMGLKTARPGGIVRKEDVSIAKNYLTETELHALNRIVNAYIEFAELQALNRRTMTMRDWIAKLDDFLKLSERDLLTHAGRISAESAKAKAELEYDRYRVLTDSRPRPVDADFEQVVKKLQAAKRIQSPPAKRKSNKKNS